MAANDLVVLNQGGGVKSHFAEQASRIDLTLAKSKIVHTVYKWEVPTEEQNLSDHRCTEFTVRNGRPDSDIQTKPKFKLRSREELIAALRSTIA